MAERPSWELSGFGDEIDADPRVQVAVLRALGASAIEVRSAWGVNIVDLGDEQLMSLRGILREREQTVSAIASPIGKVDVTLPVEHEVRRLERVIAAAHALGTTNIRIFSFYRQEGRSADEVRDAVLTRLRALADVAEREGMTLLHENEKDIYGDVPSRVLDLVQSVGSPRFRLAWDNANFVQCGVAPYSDGWTMLAPHVEYLQVKDAVAGTGEVVPAGDGDGELPSTLTALRDTGYRGYASLEPHLADYHELGGFSGPLAFGRAARAFRALTEQIGVALR